MEALRSRDLRAALEFIETAWALAEVRAFTTETLDALNELVPCDEVSYCVLDHVQRRKIEYFDTNGGEGDGDDEPFWRIVDVHPLCRHQQAYADFSATRLSDVIPRKRLVNSRIYAEWFRPSASRPSSRRASLDHAHGRATSSSSARTAISPLATARSSNW